MVNLVNEKWLIDVDISSLVLILMLLKVYFRKGVDIMRIFGYQENLLHQALNLSSKRFDQIANNIANVNTPGYIAQDMDFATELRRNLAETSSVNLKQTHTNHINVSAQTRIAQSPFNLSTDFVMRSDQNSVDIEKEIAALVENNLYYSGVATGLSNKFRLLQSVLQGGRQ